MYRIIFRIKQIIRIAKHQISDYIERKKLARKVQDYNRQHKIIDMIKRPDGVWVKQ
jgi:hypothetical protein